MNQDTVPVGFTAVLRVRAFRVLYGAELQSVVGDQLARIALSLLVFAQTGSDAATGLTYGLTFLPAIVGGFVLAHVGDLWPRRVVMIACDVLRGLTFVIMAIPGLPLPVVFLMLVLAVFVGPAFTASSVSYLASVLTQDQFRTASALRMTTNQLAQVAGFALGGVLAGVFGVHETLVLNAFTYFVSALAVLSLRRRDRGPSSSAAGSTVVDDAVESDVADSAEPGSTLVASPRRGVIEAVMRDPGLRTMVILSSLAGFFVVPEGLAVPFAAQLGVGSLRTGVLLAMIPLGSALGVVVLTRLVPNERRRPVTKAMAVVTGLPLLLAVAFPNYTLACVSWLISGMAAAYQVEALVSLVKSVADAVRARLISMLSSVLLGAQGLGPLVFSAMASVTSPIHAVAAAGLAGSVVALGAVSRDDATGL